MTRAGASLLEMLTALVLLGVSGLITVPLVLGTGRVSTRATVALAADRTTASLAALLRHDLRLATTDEVSPTTPVMLWLARPVGEGPVCATTATSLLVRERAWQGERWPEAGRDVVQALTLSGGPIWHGLSVALVSAAACPDGQAAMRLGVAADPSGSAHVRVVEPARLAAYASSGATWLGLAGVGDPIQPFAGPLTPDGLTLARVGGALVGTIRPVGGRPQLLHFPVVAP